MKPEIKPFRDDIVLKPKGVVSFIERQRHFKTWLQHRIEQAEQRYALSRKATDNQE